MTNDRSKQSEPAPKLPVESKTTRPSGDRLAAELRGFGPPGILAILIIIFSGNFFLANIIVPAGAALGPFVAYTRLATFDLKVGSETWLPASLSASLSNSL